MNTAELDTLLQVVAAFEEREVPRVGWPTSLIPPPGVSVTATERESTMHLRASSVHQDAIARLDLQTREVIIDVVGGPRDRRAAMRRLLLAFVDDRNNYDQQRGLNAHPPAPTFSESDYDTWSPLQELAHLTNCTWYPPAPPDADVHGWLQYVVDVTRFNRARQQLNAIGTRTQRILAERQPRDTGTALAAPQPAPASVDATHRGATRPR